MSKYHKKDSKPAPRIRQLFFSNVQRRPIRQVRKELRKLLPARALLGLSFVANSTLEILCDDTPNHKSALLATLLIEAMEISWFPHAVSFNPEQVFLQNLSGVHSPNARHINNLEAHRARMTASARTRKINSRQNGTLQKPKPSLARSPA